MKLTIKEIDVEQATEIIKLLIKLSNKRIEAKEKKRKQKKITKVKKHLAKRRGEK